MLTRARSVLDPETEALVERTIACGLWVHRTLGPGYHEAVYRDALAIELEEAGLAFEREVYVPLYYRGRLLRGHRLDLLIDGRVVAELKVVERLHRVHEAQVVGYLRAARLKVGLLMNFNAPLFKAGLKRIVL